MTAFCYRYAMALSVCAAAFPFAASARAEVDTDVALARSAARAGQFDQACRLGIAALEAYPESQWDRPTLRRFIVEVSQRWLHQMSPAQQAALLADVNTPASSGAIWTHAYLLWKQNQRQRGLSQLLQLIQSHPDGTGTEFAIRAFLLTQ